MVAKSEEAFLGRKIFLYKVCDRPQNKQLVTAGLVPHVVSWKVSSHIDPIKLYQKGDRTVNQYYSIHIYIAGI